MVPPATYGFFGKMPVIGDFVQRNLNTALSTALDNWLQQGMFELQQQDPAFQEQYLAAPISFFILPARIWADHPVAGFILPSVDRVGRLFPLVFLRPLRTLEATPLTALSRELETASNLAITALQQQRGVDELEQLMQGISTPSDAVPGAAAPSQIDLGQLIEEDRQSLWWQADTSAADSCMTLAATDVGRIFAFLYLRQVSG